MSGTNPWVFNFQLAVQRGDYRSARCILDNQLVINPRLNWQSYVTAEQADAIEKTIIGVSIAPEPFQSVAAKPKRKRQGDDVIVTITTGSTKLVMTGAELKAAGQAIRQESRKRKRGA